MVWMTLVMPMTAAGFMVARIVLGLAQGGNFPAAIKAVAEWFPTKERALATGWFNAGSNVAPFFARSRCHGFFNGLAGKQLFM